jgi:hypothetical protein
MTLAGRLLDAAHDGACKKYAELGGVGFWHNGVGQYVAVELLLTLADRGPSDRLDPQLLRELADQLGEYKEHG